MVVVQLAVAGGATTHVGLIVDAVGDVATIGAGDVEAPPEFCTKHSASYLVGMARIEGVVTSILDVDHLLSDAS